jgi:hypothetical protein
MWKTKHGLMGIGTGMIIAAILVQLATFGAATETPNSKRYAIVVLPNTPLDILALALIDLGVLTERQRFIALMKNERIWSSAKNARYFTFDAPPSVEALVRTLNKTK